LLPGNAMFAVKLEIRKSLVSSVVTNSIAVDAGSAREDGMRSSR